MRFKKILNGYENIDRKSFFTVMDERRTRGHGVILAKKQCILDIRTFECSHKQTCSNHQSSTFCDIALYKQTCPSHQSSTFCYIALYKQTCPNYHSYTLYII